MITSCIAYLPTADKKIEGQIVNPSGKHHPAIREKQHDTTEGAESTLMATPVGEG